MTKRSIIISSSGLRNIVMHKFTEKDDFIMIFGDKEFRMNSIYADFISPVISHLHQSDPTLQIIKFDDLITDKTSDFNNFVSDIITEDTISLLCQISSGFSIEIDETQAFKLRFLSIILGNEELFSKINEIYTPNHTEENLSIYLQYVQSCFYFSQFYPDFDFTDLVNYISNHFYLIEENEFLQLTRMMQYSIISNPNLQIKSEDNLLDIILRIIEKSDKKDVNVDDIMFLEQIEFTELSESKLRDFLSYFDLNQINNSLWRKMYQCFFNHFERKTDRIQEENRHLIKNEIFEYNENQTNRFQGIIHHLTEKYGGNVNNLNIVKVTASSVFKPQFSPQNAVNFSNLTPISTSDKNNSWIMYDFCERKVHPTHYSIRTWDMPKGNSHLKSWVIEGSNTNLEKDWLILDSRNNLDCFDTNKAEFTFDISKKIGYNESFRYLRLRQTDVNSRNTNQLILSALEYFGALID